MWKIHHTAAYIRVVNIKSPQLTSKRSTPRAHRHWNELMKVDIAFHLFKVKSHDRNTNRAARESTFKSIISTQASPVQLTEAHLRLSSLIN